MMDDSSATLVTRWLIPRTLIFSLPLACAAAVAYWLSSRGAPRSAVLEGTASLFYVASLFFGLWAFFSLLRLRPPMILALGEEELQVSNLKEPVSFRQIDGIAGSKLKITEDFTRRGRHWILWEGRSIPLSGAVRFKGPWMEHFQKTLRLAWDSHPEWVSSRLPKVLAEHWDAERERHGPENARAVVSLLPRNQHLIHYGGFLSFIAGAILTPLFCLSDQQLSREMELGAQITAGIAVALLVFCLPQIIWGRRGAKRKLADSGILMTPTSLAVKMNKVQGSLTWDKLDGAAATPERLTLKMPGAPLLIPNVFQLAPPAILREIKRFGGL